MKKNVFPPNSLKNLSYLDDFLFEIDYQPKMDEIKDDIESDLSRLREIDDFTKKYIICEYLNKSFELAMKIIRFRNNELNDLRTLLEELNCEYPKTKKKSLINKKIKNINELIQAIQNLNDKDIPEIANMYKEFKEWENYVPNDD